jgi:hypothetical protein
VRGCTIRGFATGIAIGGGAGHLVEDNRLDGSTVLGIALGSDLSTVRRNSVVDTGGSSSEPHQPVAVWTIGHVDVLDNTIAGVSTAAAGAEALGLRIDEPGFATIAGNRISGVVGVADTAVFGLQQRDGGRPVIRDNVLIGTPSEGTTGIACTDALATSTGNVVSGFATPIVACTSVGDVLNEL